MRKKIIVSVSQYEAILGLCGVSNAVEEAAIKIPTRDEDGEIEATQRLAMACKVLGQVVHAFEVIDSDYPLTAIDAGDVRTLKTALFKNGGSEEAIAARNAASQLLDRLEAEISEQDLGQENEHQGLPPGFVVPRTLSA